MVKFYPWYENTDRFKWMTWWTSSPLMIKMAISGLAPNHLANWKLPWGLVLKATAFESRPKLHEIIIRLFIFIAIIVGLGTSTHCYAESKYRIGTLIESRHYNPDDELNNRHDGLYVVYNKNVFGTFYNSDHEQSVFYARNYAINDIFSYSFGLAAGYNFGTLPIIGISAQLSILKITLTPEAAVFGFEFSL